MKTIPEVLDTQLLLSSWAILNSFARRSEVVGLAALHERLIETPSLASAPNVRCIAIQHTSKDIVIQTEGALRARLDLLSAKR